MSPPHPSPSPPRSAIRCSLLLLHDASTSPCSIAPPPPHAGPTPAPIALTSPLLLHATVAAAVALALLHAAIGPLRRSPLVAAVTSSRASSLLLHAAAVSAIALMLLLRWLAVPSTIAGPAKTRGTIPYTTQTQPV